MQRLLFSSAAAFVPFLFRLLGLTWSFRFVNRGPYRNLVLPGKPLIGALWHQTLLPATWTFRDRGICILISLSRDGELITRISRRLGYGAVRGSSSRGGREALQQMTAFLIRGGQLAVIADGPKGPAREPKIGCIIAAKRSQVPLLPIGLHIRGAARARSWDRTVIPLPFARITIAFGEPILVPFDAGEDDCETIRLLLRDRLNETERIAAANG